MKRLLLLRHGRTTYNHAGRIQGQLDSQLDETGLAQARAVAPSIAAYAPVLIRSSDLSRAAVTADIVAAECGLPVTRDPRLRERHFGDTQGMTYADFAARFPEQHRAFLAGDPEAVPGAEKISELRDRLVAGLRELLDELPEGATAVAVAHGLAIKHAVGALLGWDAEGAAVLHGMDNCHWAELRVDDDGQVRLVAYNRGTPIS